jgi:MFS family permease
LLATAISCLVLLTTWAGHEYAWGSPVIIGMAVAVVLLVVSFVMVERRAEEPALPLRLFRIRTFCIASAVLFCTGVIMFAAITYLPTFLQVGSGASASGSGLLLTPLFLGVFASSILAGQLITRTGRWRVFPMVGTALSAVGMYLLSTLDSSSSRLASGVYMTIVGVGVGLTMQVLILATQNESPAEDLGVATSTANFFRAVGSAVGVALFGTLFATRVRDLLGARANLDLTPAAVQKLPPAVRTATAHAFADAITHVFLYAVPLMVVAFVLTWFVRETPLRTTSGQVRRALSLEVEFAEDSAAVLAGAEIPSSTVLAAPEVPSAAAPVPRPAGGGP